MHNKKKDIDRIDLDNINNTFRTGELIKSLGLSRDTLRYYEEIGLINPEKETENNYRKFKFYDVFNLWGIDFFKKRGFSLLEIQQVIEKHDFFDLKSTLEQKEKQIESEIQKKKRMLRKIKETRILCETLDADCNSFSVKEFPLYEIKSEFTSMSVLAEYNEKVLGYLNLDEEDIISSVIRKMTFDDEGYQDTIMYMVEEVNDDKLVEGKQYLEYGKCIYTIVESGRLHDKDNEVAEKTMRAAMKWAKENCFELKGEVYLKVRLILFQNGSERAFVEAWAPIK